MPFPILSVLDRLGWPPNGVWPAFWTCCVLLFTCICLHFWSSWGAQARRHLGLSSPGYGKLQPDYSKDDKTSETEGVSTNRDNNTSREVRPPKAELGLQILHDCAEPMIDIIAVHGLGANPDYAWVWLPKNNPPNSPGYPDEPFNWLEKLLPTKLSCRILAFSYDSAWISNAPQQRLSNISDNLLDGLRNKRDEATDRPLIFIGHSFGGNVIEQAIVSASRHRSEYLAIAESTVGVIFLGTPHRGSKAAAWGALIASLAPPGFVTEDRLLKALEEQSDSLTDRLHDFSRWLFSESVPVVCAFEQLVTDYSSRIRFASKVLPKQLVVPEASACIDGHHRISLNTDHLKINKFYGSSDPSFKRVYPEIQRMAEGAKETLARRRSPKAIPTDERFTFGSLQECLQQMRVTNPLDILSNVQDQKGKRVGHTCEWILKREEFTGWGASDEPQLLRLIGSPGIGKTMMSTFLVKELKDKVEKTPGKAFAYFFCDDKDQDRKTPTAILRSLVWQLLLQRNELFQRNVQPDFEKHRDDRVFDELFNKFHPLWRIFKTMVQDERAGEVFVIIDALDECERSTRRNLILSIRELFLSLPARDLGNLKLLITCRPGISDIEDELQSVGASLQIDSADINDDLAKYIDARVDDLASQKKYTSQLEEKVSNTLKREAGGTFLWASLMIAELRDALKFEVEAKLKSLPHGLDSTYDTILNRISIKDRETAQFILRCMIAARRPLKKIEIQTAFATWKTNSILCREHLEDYDDILSPCSSILFVSRANGDDATLNFCHQSVKDFLLREVSGTDRKWYHAPEDEAHLHIFKMCWEYISADEFNHGNLLLYRAEAPTGTLVKAATWELKDHYSQHLFLEYSSSEWENHAAASYPALLDKQGLVIDVTKAPTLRDALLLRAVRDGQEAIVMSLIEKGAEVEFHDQYGRTPLSYAAGGGFKTIVEFLLRTGRVNICSRDYGSQTPLLWAAANGHTDVVRVLITIEGAGLDCKDYNGWTPLLWAAANGHELIVKSLLAAEELNPTPPDCGRRSLLLCVVKSTKVRPLGYNRTTTAGGNHTLQDYQRQLMLLEQQNKRRLMMGRLMGPQSVQGPQEHTSWSEKKHEIIKLLLEKGADVEATDMDFRTPLSWAAEKGHEAIVKLLIEMGANVESKNMNGRTPLSWAAWRGHEVVVKLLVEMQANIESKDMDGRTPLLWAAGGGYEAVVKLLLEKGANIEVKDNDGQTALFWSATNGHEAVVKLLVEKGANIEAKNGKYRETPLWRASTKEHEGVIKLLLDKGANIEARSFGETPLWRATSSGRVAVAKLLLDKGANVEAKNGSGETPLWRATANGHEAVVKLLLNRGADVEVKVHQEVGTPLVLAAANGQETIVRLLLDKGADVEAKTIYGETPLQRASAKGYEAVGKLLREYAR